MPTLTLGFSPCPNDTYIFHALVNGLIDTGNLRFEPVMADVEELNGMSAEGKLDVTKLSIGAYPQVSNRYVILDAGAALGKGVGPLLVKKPGTTMEAVESGLVAIPGKRTTANFLLSLFYPQIRNKKELIFSDIDKSVKDGTVTAGLLIHEGRFTYQSHGLELISDLGLVWEHSTGKPLPLGVIAANRKLEPEVARQISDLIRESIFYARMHPDASKKYIRNHAQEMDENVTQSHIKLYVNEYSVDLGAEGKAAIFELFETGKANKLTGVAAADIFLNYQKTTNT
ncbi:MAG TPA: 1,4-dihydroxy-6-naphthoate synthase [Bacteroidia bacterium]|nr:1,4-dihydroxy-6-naphthoate synthase [Bacteroidia bacterium]